MREFRDQIPPGKQPRPVVTTPLIVYGKCTIRSGSDLVFDMTSSELASNETNVKLTVLFDELLELNKRKIRDVLASSPLRSQYLDSKSVYGAYLQRAAERRTLDGSNEAWQACLRERLHHTRPTGVQVRRSRCE